MFPICRHLTASPNVAGKNLVIGVFALQGDVREHETVLTDLGVVAKRVRTKEDLNGLDGIVIPGGESSVMDKLARIFGLRDPLREAIRAGLPVLGTCAGLIMLSDSLIGSIEGQETLGGLDVVVERNAFGSQVESFETELEVPLVSVTPLRVAFIRAPIIRSVGKAEVIASLPNGDVVGVRHGKIVGVSFHPEVVGETRLHEWWLKTVVAGL